MNLKKFHLKDATEAFNAVKGHGDEFAINELDKYCIGPIKDIDIKQKKDYPLFHLLFRMN